MKTKKFLALALAAVLLVAVSVAGTMAWLMDTSDEVTNTFTPTTLSVDLQESENLDFTMVPGATITKDPKVTYKSDVEAWLFVEVMEKNAVANYIDYSVITGNNAWQSVPGTTNVYYREVDASDNGGPFSVIQDAAKVADKVTVKSTVTKAMMDALYTDGAVKPAAELPTLNFQAYIIQKTAADTPKAAWDLAKAQ